MHPAKKRILIVDDDARNVFALKAVLKSRGYDCMSAEGALEALSMIDQQQDICIILLDMMMPGMDGYQIISKLRAGDRKHLPIISVTAQAMPGDQQKCIDAGADAYVSKPVDVDKLLDRLKQYVK